MSAVLVQTKGLRVHYGSGPSAVRAVDDVRLALPKGSITGLVGESGCGKSTLARALTGVLPDAARYDGGVIWFNDKDLTQLTKAERDAVLWRQIAFVPQSAMNALNPVHRVGAQLCEVLKLRGGYKVADARVRAAALLESVGLDVQVLRAFPHQLSGGMRQRVSIAMALALDPELIIADEPVTALDVIVQRQILDLLIDLQRTRGITVLLVTHDISVVAYACDHMIAMYGGRIITSGPTDAVLSTPKHPYVMGLKNAFPDPLSLEAALSQIEGSPPRLDPPPPGCRFAERCPFALDICRTESPYLQETGDGHAVACHRAEEADTLRGLAAQAETWVKGSVPL